MSLISSGRFSLNIKGLDFINRWLVRSFVHWCLGDKVIKALKYTLSNVLKIINEGYC